MALVYRVRSDGFRNWSLAGCIGDGKMADTFETAQTPHANLRAAGRFGMTCEHRRLAR
jgi:hypothetical protein